MSEIKNVQVERTPSGRVRRRVMQDISGPGRVLAARITRVAWLMVIALESLLGIRFLLKLIAANPAAPAARLIYRLSRFFLLPFEGLTPTPAAEGFIFEIHTVIAMLIYLLLGWLAVELIRLLLKPIRARRVETYEESP
jgi:hypothetical protein